LIELAIGERRGEARNGHIKVRSDVRRRTKLVEQSKRPLHQ
jgi:hypothetical protein